MIFRIVLTLTLVDSKTIEIYPLAIINKDIDLDHLCLFQLIFYLLILLGELKQLVKVFLCPHELDSIL